jgi:GGDEF domain-containing protein
MSEIARELAALEELRLISERLLLAGLREHERLAEARRVTELLEDEALHDPPTGLPNRALLHARLEQAIHVARREHTSFAICFLDLDRFKTVNDRFGHQVGDQLLRAVAGRLRSTLREAEPSLASTGMSSPSSCRVPTSDQRRSSSTGWPMHWPHPTSSSARPS